ncbi:hypothetical protein OV208_12670 [Corallococcus sp. bb12-1]|uniref:hypothetical protein n=1 Tax=Corallococcus sp. bb12-1 TaxID=2996784 RepID=UPI002270F414|nr:hypothetical protein [Corallococcus sp. bb12-1]MCY1042170.1 hypothetical protein [Corallococcus sp. bb12-1]
MTEHLRPVFHPEWGRVHPMRESKQATHVWQHLYNPEERWDALVGTDIQVLASAAEQQGAPPPPRLRPGQARPQLPRVSKRCYILLKEHHDAYYAPVYLRELDAARTQWAVQTRETRSLLCCTPRGVLIAVSHSHPRAVLTAYRPSLPVSEPGDGSDADYQVIARSHWEGLTMPDDSTWKRGLLRELEEAGRQQPRRALDAWRLARAIGHGRALVVRAPGIVPHLDSAEALLARHRQDVIYLLEGRLRSDASVAGLDAALEAAEPHEVQEQLVSLADFLVVFEVLDQQVESHSLQERIQRILKSWPPKLTGFDLLAQAWLETAGPTVRPLWASVLAAQTTLSARTGGMLDQPADALGTRVRRRIQEAISLTRVWPAAAYASSGIDLGPEPLELHRWDEAVLSLTPSEDLQTLMLQVSGLGRRELPSGTRDGIPLEFIRDEFDAWLTDALPGAYLITLRDTDLEFNLVG